MCASVIGAAALLTVDGDRVLLFGIASPMRCFMRQVVGVKCAFCGMTRSFIMMAHGHPALAMDQHPFGPILFVYICLQIPYRIAALIVHGPMPGGLTRAGIVAGIIIVVAILGNWLLYIGGLLV